MGLCCQVRALSIYSITLEFKCITFLILTERKGGTEEYWPEVVAVRTERSKVRTKTTEGQYSPVRLELARLVSSLLYGFLVTFCFVFVRP